MKTLITVITIFMSTSNAFAVENNPKRILMMISTGFYAPEYFKPRKIFKEAGFRVDVAAKYSIPITPDRRQINDYPAVRPDLTFKEVSVEKYDAVVFAGGNGAWEDFFPNQNVHKILTDAMEQNKVVALVCSSTGLLGVANNLQGNGTPIAQGRNVTGYKRVIGLLKILGKVRYHSGNPKEPFVMVDGNLITGRDPMSSELFGKTVVRALR